MLYLKNFLNICYKNCIEMSPEC